MDTQSKILEVVLELRDKMSPALGDTAKKSTAQVKTFQDQLKATGQEMFNLNKVALNLVAGFGAMIIIQKVTQFMKECAAGAAEAHKVNQELIDSLKAVGHYSAETVEEFKNLASEYQKLYVVNDEAVKGIMATIATLTTLSTNKIPDATKAVMGLATMFKMDMNSAAMALSKTLEGNVNMLGRYGIEVDMAKDATGRLADIMVQSNKGLDIMHGRLADVTGRIEAQKLALEDLKDEIGDKVIPIQLWWSKLQVYWLDIITGKWKEARDAAWEYNNEALPGLIPKTDRGASSGFGQGASSFFGPTTPYSQAPGASIMQALGIDIGKAEEAGISVEGGVWKLPTRGPTGGAPSGSKGDPIYVRDITSEMGILRKYYGLEGAFGGLNAPRSYEDMPMGWEPWIDESMRGSKWQEPPRTYENMPMGWAPWINEDMPGLKWEDKMKGGFNWDKAFSSDMMWNMAGAGIQGAMQGGGMGALAGMLPVVGSAFGPVGTIVGSLLGGLLGKQKQRGDTAAQPVHVKVINMGDLATEIFKASMAAYRRVSGMGIDSITAQLHAQAGSIPV